MLKVTTKAEYSPHAVFERVVLNMWNILWTFWTWHISLNLYFSKPGDFIVQVFKTDTLPDIEWVNPDRPEQTNLLNIYLAVQTERAEENILKEVKDMKWADFKPMMTEAVMAHSEPI